jgi:hypothetical protein
MILLYTMMLFVLGMFKFTLSLRAKALERKYVKLAVAVDTLLRQAEYKPGNSNKVDPCAAAKRTLHLGQLVEQRDRVEAKHVTWQVWADRFTRWFVAVREWQGKKLPYTLGAVDVWMLMNAIDYFGVGQVLNTTNAIDMLASLWTK